MNIIELTQLYNLNEDTIRAVEKVNKISGKDVEFRVKDDLKAHALLKAARDFMPKHVVFIKRDKMEHIDHLIVHECHHIFRFWSVEEAERKIISRVPQLSQQRKKQWKRELGKKSDMYPDEVFDLWDNGLMTLFYNAVTDTRIELSIRRSYPGIRVQQIDSLKTLENELRESISKDVKKITPPSLFLLSGAMNYVFLTRLSSIIGRSWKRDFKREKEVVELGNKLLQTIPEEDKGLEQDIALLNKWAKILDIGPLKWVDFEAVSPNYINQG